MSAMLSKTSSRQV